MWISYITPKLGNTYDYTSPNNNHLKFCKGYCLRIYGGQVALIFFSWASTDIIWQNNVFNTHTHILKCTNENKMLKRNEDQITSSDDDNQTNNMVASNMRNMQPQKVLQMQPSVHLLKSPMKIYK